MRGYSVNNAENSLKFLVQTFGTKSMRNSCTLKIKNNDM